nr:hypothetical protein [Tanacetum cinerariifolium]
MKKEFKHKKSQTSDDRYQWHRPEARTSQNPLRVAEGKDHAEGKKKVPRKGRNPKQKFQESSSSDSSVGTSGTPSLEPVPSSAPGPLEKVVVSSDSEGSEADDFSELKKITALLVKAFNRRKFYYKPTNNNLRTSSSSQSANKKLEFVKTDTKKVEKKDDEKKRDMSRVKCYNCKNEGHFAKDCKKAKGTGSHGVLGEVNGTVQVDAGVRERSVGEKGKKAGKEVDAGVRDGLVEEMGKNAGNAVV